jgi:hypothetical protein
MKTRSGAGASAAKTETKASRGRRQRMYDRVENGLRMARSEEGVGG